MGGVARRMVSIFVWVIVSIVVAFVLTFAVGGYVLDQMLGIYIDETGAIFLGFFLWVIAMVLSKRAFLGSGGMEMAGGDWQPAAQVRETVVNSPQFRGKVDRRMGLLEATVRRPQYDQMSYKQTWTGWVKEFTILTLRAELLDEYGSPIEYVPVMIRGEKKKWVGDIADGDRIRVKGKFEKDGILHAKNAFNFNTNSLMGER